jgi:hypothetical protein
VPSLIGRLLVVTLGFAALPAQPAEKPFDPAREAYVVFGVKPDGFVVELTKGRLTRHGGGKGFFTWGSAIRSAAAQHDYVVLRIPADTVVGLTRLRRGQEYKWIYYFCSTDFVPVFEVPPGKVVYLGDLAFTWPENRAPWYTFALDLDAARAHVDANYPELRGRLELDEFASMRTTRSCSKNSSLDYD